MFSSYFTNGVFVDDSSSDHLRVEKAQGLTLTVKAGRANINGAFYWQKDDETITLEKNTATKNYNIILRLNDNDAYRNITLVASDINNGITRSDSIYDLVIATVTVTGNASEVKGSDITDTRLDSTRCGAVTSAIKSVQSLDLFTQITELFKEIKAQNESEMNANRTEFNDWFETVKDTLDANTAGKLSNRISNIEKMIMENHFTTILLTEDGTLVDENGHEILADWQYKVDGNEWLNCDSDNTGNSDNIAYELENLRNQMKFELERIKAETSQLNEDLDTIRIKYANLFKINPNIQDVSVSNGSSSVYVNENYIDVEEGKHYFVYVKFKITNLTNWVQGYVYARLIYDVDAGGWAGTALHSIKNDGEYLICYNFIAKKSGKVGMQLYFNNQIPSTNTFSCQCTKLFVAQTSNNIKEMVDSEEQTSGISKVILKSETVTWDNLTNDVKKKIERTPTNFTIIDCWGDSLTQGAGATNYPYPTKLQELIGDKFVVNNYGQGSETAEVIAFRQGSMGAIVVPFTAGANVSDYNKVTINSVNGASLETMSYSGKYYGNCNVYLNGRDKWMFRRGDGGSLNLVCADRSLLGKEYSRPTIAFAEGEGTGHVAIICIGQNGWAGQTSRPEALADIIQKMVVHNGSERYIVVGRPTGNKNERNIEEIILASRFSNHFVNAREYISKYGLLDSNLTPTTEDTEAMSNGAIPPQLRTDGVHMNDYGYIAMANCVYQRGVALNYWS